MSGVVKKKKEFKIRKLKLFMASPSDTSEERKAFSAVVHSINRLSGSCLEI